MQSVLTLYLLLLTLLILCHSQVNTTIAIQNELQTYYGYLTLSECSPPSPIIPGTVAPVQLTPFDGLEAIQLADQLTFWGPVYEGLTILPQLDKLLGGSQYKQVVYYNSSLQDNLSSREVILTSFTGVGNIMLTYAIVEIGSVDQAQIEVQYNLTTNFNDDILDQNQQCFQSSILQMAFIGNSSFLVTCPNSSILYAFDISYPSITFSYNIQDVSSFNSLASNPDLLLPGEAFEPDAWQAALLINESSELLLCSFNQSEAFCSSYSDDLSWLQVVGARAWGLDASTEEQQLLTVMQLYPSLERLSFPGTIISIYRSSEYVYMQTKAKDKIYLIVLQGDLLLVNVSIPGQVILYAGERIVVQSSNNSLWIVDLVLPYFTIESGEQTAFNISYDCQAALYSVNYSIIWTDYAYPSAVVVPLSNGQIIAEQGVFTYNLNQAFQSIGPAFEVFIQNSSPIDITLLSPPTIPITQHFVALLEISIVSQLEALFYFLSSTGELTLISSIDPTHRIIARNPCSFTTTPSASKRGQNYIISNEDGETCVCQPFLKNCSLLKQVRPSEPPSQTNNSLRKQIYTRLLNKQLINVYTNGSVVLETFSGAVLASLSSGCAYNSTDVILFPRTIKDDLMLVLCESASSVTQYLLRGNEFLFNRDIPLYGFVSRLNGTFKAGKNYVYLEVDIDPNFDPPLGINQNKDCCILRLDPNAFTVSTIVEVVQAKALVLIQTVAETDVVYYNMSGLSQQSPYLKIYMPSVWISLSNPPICRQNSPCPPVSYSFSLTFASLVYNFASSFGQTITFDLESSALSASPPPLQLSLNQVDGSGPELSGTEVFNLSWVCGPIMSFWASQGVQNSTNQDLYSLSTNSIVINNKLISLLEPALQIIDLEPLLLPESSLSSLLMVVTTNSIYLYIKFTDIWLAPLPIIPLPVSNCLFYLYAQPNSSSVQFASSCYNLRIPTPVLTIVYPSSANNSLNYSFGQFLYPKQLRNIITFPRPGEQPLVLGLEEGPSKSITGILAYCQKQCGELQTAVEIEFMMDFDAVQAQAILVVVALDSNFLSFWLDLPPPSATTPIPPNKVLNYRAQTGQLCDSVKIVDVPNAGEVSLLLGCTDSYFFLRTDVLAQNLQVVSQYKKFSNCDPVNPTKPTWVLEGSSLSLLVAACLQNQQTVKTQQFQTIVSSNSSIVTAYMQVYTLTGPNCVNLHYPARILPLAVSRGLETFSLYQINNTLKLLFQTMSGQLIDAFIDSQPETQLTLTHLSKQPINWNLTLKLRNPYCHLQLPVRVTPQSNPPNKNITLVLLIVFLITNLSTLVFLICWLAFKRQHLKRARPEGHLQEKDSLNQNSSSIGASSIRQALSIRSSAKKVPRRVTEIQLFQPRYQPS